MYPFWVMLRWSYEKYVILTFSWSNMAWWDRCYKTVMDPIKKYSFSSSIKRNKPDGVFPYFCVKISGKFVIFWKKKKFISLHSFLWIWNWIWNEIYIEIKYTVTLKYYICPLAWKITLILLATNRFFNIRHDTFCETDMGLYRL